MKPKTKQALKNGLGHVAALLILGAPVILMAPLGATAIAGATMTIVWFLLCGRVDITWTPWRHRGPFGPWRFTWHWTSDA